MSEILEHATRLFAARGYDGTTLQDIADAIGITRPGLYNYISSKEQLLAALVRDVSENTAHIVREVRHRTGLSSVEKLRTVVRALVLQRAGAPERFRVLDRTEAALPGEVASLHLKARREVLAEVRTIIEEGVSPRTPSTCSPTRRTPGRSPPRHTARCRRPGRTSTTSSASSVQSPATTRARHGPAEAQGVWPARGLLVPEKESNRAGVHVIWQPLGVEL
jgi:AcrR family transcriptional regulator